MSTFSYNARYYYSVNSYFDNDVSYQSVTAGNYSIVWNSVTEGAVLQSGDSASFYTQGQYISDVQFIGVADAWGLVLFLSESSYFGLDYYGSQYNNFAVNPHEVISAGFSYNILISYSNQTLDGVILRSGSLINDKYSHDNQFDGYIQYNVGDDVNEGLAGVYDNIPGQFAGFFQSASEFFLVTQSYTPGAIFSTFYGLVDSPDTFMAPDTIPNFVMWMYSLEPSAGPAPTTSREDARIVLPEREPAVTMPLEYIASYADLRAAFGTDAALGRAHFLELGLAEGRSASFSGLDYIASYTDLITALGADRDAGARHFITNGAKEGRLPDTFDAVRYLANYADLRMAFGADTDAAAAHFITFGHAEGRTDDIWTAA